MDRGDHVKTSTAVALVVGAVAVVGIGAKLYVDRAVASLYAITPKTKPTPGTEGACDRMNGKTCELDVSVTVTGNTCVATAKNYVKLGEEDDVKRIEWILPTGYKACPRAGDGAFFYDKPDIGDDKFELDKHGACATKIGWARKKKDSSDYDYAYILRFRDNGSNVQCISDPWFKNG